MKGIRFIDSVAEVVEAEAHHPDFEIVYTRVKFTIQKHPQVGITLRDFGLAKAIDGMEVPGR